MLDGCLYTEVTISLFYFPLERIVFSLHPLLIWYKNLQLVPDEWQIQSFHVSTCLKKLHLILISYIIIKMQILMLIKWPYSPSKSCSLLLYLNFLTYFEKHNPIYSKHMYFWCQLISDPLLTTYHSNICFHIGVVFDSGTSTIAPSDCFNYIGFSTS